MNIVYQGGFLKEGLHLLGHTVIEIAFSNDDDINERIASLGVHVDIVLLELWSHKNIPSGLHACRTRLVAYCIDSPINAYWQSEICKVFDDVFVDQKATVFYFAKQQIKAKWLPLCAQMSYFRDIHTKKIYDILFVGNTSHYRIKRNNLLTFLKKHFSLHIYQNISSIKMMDLFSQSKIVLNENLFTGLTLRVFQGIASGSLVLTEEGGDGVHTIFQDGKHLICYNAQNILQKIEDILQRYDAYADIIRKGYTCCKTQHTSQNRASDIMECLHSHRCHNERLDEDLRKFYETKAHYYLKMRFGGSLRKEISNFTLLADTHNAATAASALELGNIAARNGDAETAAHLYGASRKNGCAVGAGLKMVMVHAYAKRFYEAKKLLSRLLLLFPRRKILRNKHLIESIKTAEDESDILYILAQLYFIKDNIFSVGFLKQCADKYPDTALEIAFLAWEIKPSEHIMDFMISCSKICNIEVELLPLLISSIQKGQLTDRQILYTSECARKCFNFDLSATILRSYKRSL